jgi:hypothetical protein
MRPPRIARPPTGPAPIRLRAYYRTAGALLRELSSALNRGRTLLRAESGLAVGTRLALVMMTDSLKAPIEVSGTVTAWRRRGARHEMALRYDFDPAPFRRRLAQALAELKRETLPPRLGARVPMAVQVDALPLARRLRAVLENVSRTGCRLELSGPRLPSLAVGGRIDLTLRGSRPGTRSPRRLLLDIRWVGRRRGAGGRNRVMVGGRFLAPGAAARERIRTILRLEDLRPRVAIRKILPPPRSPQLGPGRGRLGARPSPGNGRGRRKP